MKLLSGAASVLIIAFSASANAEVALSFYTGFQGASDSSVSGNDPGGAGDFDFDAGWEGKPFAAPPYYGLRAVWWREGNLGYGVDFTHAKIYADDDAQADNGFSSLEFTDGLNFLTGNVFYRWQDDARRWTPYVGAGAGVAIPHVDVKTAAAHTFEYQVVGPTVQIIGGVSYDLNERWAVFGEYKGNYTEIDADLDSGGSLKTDVLTHALNIGVSLRF